jgi:DNA-binding NarL/FixJ family response regulator
VPEVTPPPLSVAPIETHAVSRARPRALIADDHPVMLSALARLARGECDVIGTASNGEALLHDVRQLRPDLVILDIFMPEMDGFAAGRLIRDEFPQTRLIYVTLQPDPGLMAEATRIGASALVAKALAGSHLAGAIRKTMADKARNP